MKKIQIMMLAILITGLVACQKKDDVKSPSKSNNTIPQKSKKELLVQTWVLDETYTDGVRKTSGGTDQYQWSAFGSFKFLESGTWMEIGTYSFTSKDSNAISVKFTGTTTPVIMALKTLDEKSLKTEFMSGGKKFNYNYKR
jgi:hypothetical protein